MVRKMPHSVKGHPLDNCWQKLEIIMSFLQFGMVNRQKNQESNHKYYKSQTWYRKGIWALSGDTQQTKSAQTWKSWSFTINWTLKWTINSSEMYRIIPHGVTQHAHNIYLSISRWQSSLGGPPAAKSGENLKKILKFLSFWTVKWANADQIPIFLSIPVPTCQN